jgi:hypothetical protein
VTGQPDGVLCDFVKIRFWIRARKITRMETVDDDG